MSIAGYPGLGKTVLMLRLALETYFGSTRVFLANGKKHDSFKAFAALGIPRVDDDKQTFFEWLQYFE